MAPALLTNSMSTASYSNCAACEEDPGVTHGKRGKGVGTAVPLEVLPCLDTTVGGAFHRSIPNDRQELDQSWKAVELSCSGNLKGSEGVETIGKSDIMEESLLHSDDIENHCNARLSRVNEAYTPLPESTEPESQDEEALGHARPNWRSRNRVLLIICCTVAILLVIGAFVSYNVIAHSEGGLSGLPNDDGENDFYKSSRTGFHFQPEHNWMNDPNAPMFYLGYYHLFYQWNPHGSVWGDIVWGHAVSTDLVHWQYLELAIMPDQWYDEAGAWSGSATILQDGTPAILYTGASDAGNVQSQCLALPVDPTDPLLKKWKKVENNPIIVNPQGIAPKDFRDPTTAWLETDGLWRIAVGAKIDNTDGTRDGISLLYKSKDFQHWDIDHQLLHEVRGTGMWECVDFFPVLVEGKVAVNHSVLRGENYVDTYKYVLKASLDDTRHDHYAIGTYSTQNHTFTADDPTLDVGIGYRYDYGKFYASKTFFDSKTNRRILWGWANESDSEQDDIIKGWASVMAIPRTLWLDGSTTDNLLQWPVAEVDSLRGAKATSENILLEPTQVVKVRGGDGPQLDILVSFEKPDVNSVDGVKPEDVEFDCSQGGSAHRGVFGPFGLLVHTDDALTEQTGVFFYISPLEKGRWTTRVCSDQSRSSLALGLDKTVYGSYVTVLPTENTLSLRVLVDHSIVETFVQGGRLAITSRVYPTVASNSKSHLFLFNNGTTSIRVKSLEVYQMRGVVMTTL